MVADLKKIVNQLSELTVLEASSLSKLLEEKWGVSASNVISSESSENKSDSDALVIKKDIFDITLVSSGGKKIQVIKEVRAMTGLGLKESKDLVEGVPKILKNGVPKQEAEEIKSKFESIGATVELG